MPDLVSVIIPTYNRQNLFQEAIETVYTQTYDRLEVIVVDDSDTSVDFSEVHDSIDVNHLRNQQPQGLAAARNQGIEAASGTYIAFLDDDDRWVPEKIQCQIDTMEERGLDLCTCHRMMSDGADSWIAGCDVSGNLVTKLLKENVVGPPSGVVVRRSIFSKAGYFDESFDLWEDRDWYLRVAQTGTVGVVESPLLWYRVDTADKMSGNIAEARRSHQKLREKYRTLVDQVGQNRFNGWFHRKLGRMYYEKGDRKRAASSAARAIRLDPMYWPAYRLLVRSVLGESRYTKLETALGR